METLAGYVVIKHRTFRGPGAPTAAHAHEQSPLPSAKVLGGPRGRRHAFRPGSVVNVSGMSFGALSGNAIEALNRGAELAGCLQNTGEGGVSPYHRNGGDLVFQIGTSYFGCRDEDGRFDLGKLKELVESAPIRAIEIKLSQGAKPGLGGMLPGAKVSEEIAEIRGIKPGVDCASPSRHTAFSTSTRCSTSSRCSPTRPGCRSASSRPSATWSSGTTWSRQMAGPAARRRLRERRRRRGRHRRGADDLRGRGGLPVPGRLRRTSTSASPQAGLTDDVTFIGGGKLGIPENAVVAFAMGVDMVNVGREAMLSIGCIQAQKCHTDHCPVGVATQNPRYTRGLDPTLKSVRAANYVKTLRRDLLKVSEAVGVSHPGLITPDDVDVIDGVRGGESLRSLYGYATAGACPARAPATRSTR